MKSVNQHRRLRPHLCVLRALIGLFALLIREIVWGLHSWVNFSPQKTYRSDLVLQVICTVLVSMVTDVRVLHWGPLGGVVTCMYAYASMTTASSVALCHKYKAFLVDGVSSYTRASWTRTQLSHSVSRGPLAILTLDKNSPIKYTATT